ncbi:MAG: ABC transporter permease [Bacteroidales bacterium]|nr:ABC transporter permease [Bacteroidales bacterium]
MYTILAILKKEFIQIFRDKVMLPVIFVVPVVQFIILVHAATLEMKEIRMLVIDYDRSPVSNRLYSEFEGSRFYSSERGNMSIEQAEALMLAGDCDAIMIIPNGFEKNLNREKEASVQLMINAINGTVAGLIENYSTNIIMGFNKNLMLETGLIRKRTGLPGIKTTVSFWYNPEMNYYIFMVPGIMVILVTIFGMFLTAFNLVREKEMGTIEQINVTPIKRYQFIFGKLFPFLLIALFELGLGLLLGVFIFHLPVVGSVWLLFGFATVYLMLALGIGLFLSTISSSQQQVVFITFFFALVFILMSGIFTPTESMPEWAQHINIINPFFYFMRAIRMILLKGSEAADLAKEFISLSVYAIIMLSLAVVNYRKTGA